MHADSGSRFRPGSRRTRRRTRLCSENRPPGSYFIGDVARANLVADAVQHPPFDAGHRRRRPGQVRRVDDLPALKIRSEGHQGSASSLECACQPSHQLCLRLDPSGRKDRPMSTALFSANPKLAAADGLSPSVCWCASEAQTCRRLVRGLQPGLVAGCEAVGRAPAARRRAGVR